MTKVGCVCAVDRERVEVTGGGGSIRTYRPWPAYCSCLYAFNGLFVFSAATANCGWRVSWVEWSRDLIIIFSLGSVAVIRHV